MNKPLERNMSYDLIRSVAILLVIGIHCLEGISYYPILMNQVVVSTPSWIVQSLFYVVGRMGVPLFLMLTGALMLKRELVLDKSYMCTKVLPLYIPTVIWTFIYFLAATIKASDVPTPKSMIAFFVRAIFLDTASSPHLWYMSAIIGLYLFLPLLSHIVKYCSEKTLLNSLLVAGILAMVLPTFNLFIHINGFGETVDFSVSSVRNRSLILPLYAIMLMMGYLLEEKRLIKNVKTCYLILAVAINIVIVLLLQYQSMAKRVTGQSHYFWYDNVFIVTASVGLFELLTRIPVSVKFVRFLCANLARYSFGIYLIHIIFFWTAEKIMEPVSIGSPIKIVVSFVFSLICSLGAVMLLSLIPGVNKILFNAKSKTGRSSKGT